MTLQDISLTEQERPKGAHEEVFTWESIEIPNDTSYEEFDVE